MYKCNRMSSVIVKYAYSLNTAVYTSTVALRIQVGRLYRALILLGLALYLPCASVS